MTARELLESISVIIAVDGKLADEEKQYLFSVAKQLGVSKGDLNSVFDKVREGRGVVANPKSAKDQADLYAHLVTAAASDGEISTKERRILNDVGEHFGISVPPSRHGGGGVDHAELILQTDPQGGRGTTAASADTHRASGSALSHFFWAASVSLIALGSIGAVLFYKYVPSPRAGSEAAADAAGTFYDDLKGGLKNGLSAVGTMLQTKETTIHNAVMLAWSSEPELIVGKGLISVTSEGKQDRLVWGFDTNVVVNVSDIQVQYIIPLGNLPEL
jgi:tellurite resistance protein